MSIPRGIRNNNPLNLRPSGDTWIGLRTDQTDPGYLQFQTSFHGIRAGVKNLLTYFRVRKLRTPTEIIGRWAPPSDNNPTDEYVATVADALGVKPNDQIDLENRLVMCALVKTMIGVECGQQPFSSVEIDVAMTAAYGSHSAPPESSDIVTPYIKPPLPQPPPQPAQTPPQVPPKVFPDAPPATPPVSPGHPPLVDQPSPLPTRKLVVGGAVGTLAFVIVVLWNRAFPESPIATEYATEIAGLIILVATLVTQYFVRNRATDIPPGPTPPETPSPEKTEP